MSPFFGFSKVAFYKDRQYDLDSIGENDRAIIVIDTKTLKEIKRMMMNKASEKDNVYDRNHYASGTRRQKASRLYKESMRALIRKIAPKK